MKDISADGLLTTHEFEWILNKHSIVLSAAAKTFISQKYVIKDKQMLPYKDVLRMINIDLSKDNPFDHEWVIRKNKHKWRDPNDNMSVASSYMLSSVLSATSKRMNIDNILQE